MFTELKKDAIESASGLYSRHTTIAEAGRIIVQPRPEPVKWTASFHRAIHRLDQWITDWAAQEYHNPRRP